MIHNFCYSHLIMINTLMYCTVNSTSTSTVLSTLYSTKCIIIFCSAQFYFIFFWKGGLSPPSPNDAPPLGLWKERILGYGKKTAKDEGTSEPGQKYTPARRLAFTAEIQIGSELLYSHQNGSLLPIEKVLFVVGSNIELPTIPWCSWYRPISRDKQIHAEFTCTVEQYVVYICIHTFNNHTLNDHIFFKYYSG